MRLQESEKCKYDITVFASRVLLDDKICIFFTNMHIHTDTDRPEYTNTYLHIQRHFTTSYLMNNLYLG